MCDHKVVIASLPLQAGTSSAARVVTDMLRSFPKIRLGLMVGIGGGAPSSRHDIRLGNIVVSVPDRGTGGVLQYDYGKMEQNKQLQVTGHLNRPPDLLLGAVRKLEAVYQIRGHQLEQAIDAILEKK